MRKILMGLIVSTVLSWGTTVKAEMLGSELGAFYSYVDSEDLGIGHGLGAKLKLNVMEILSIEGRASYMEFEDNDIEMIPLEAAAMFVLPLGNFRPYAGLGAGYYIFSGNGWDLSDEIGYFPMVGLQLNIGSDLGLFAEGRWVFLESDIENSPNEVDVSGLGVNIGISLLF